MRKVSFIDCNLKCLPRKFLEQFVAAEVIDIAFRRVQTINSEDFRGNVNLKKLYAKHNELTQLPSHLFNYTLKIREIDFSHNKIENVDPSAFAVGVENLIKIDFSWNQIKILDGRTFANAISLTKINLNFNQIEEFGTKLIQISEVQHSDKNKKNTSSNCMIFPFKSRRTLIRNLSGSGTELIQLGEVQHLDESKQNTSSNHMIFPFKSRKTLWIYVSCNKPMSTYLKFSFSLIKSIEVSCNSDTRYLLKRNENFCVKMSRSHLCLLTLLHNLR